MIARADDGGLGTVCWEFARHLHPAKALVAHTRHMTRNQAVPERIGAHSGEMRCCPGPPSHDDLRWLLDGIDVVYSAETWYSTALASLAARSGVRTVLHTMPEYYLGEPADVLLAPTPWRLDLLPAEAQVLPVPVATDRFVVRDVRSVKTLYTLDGGLTHDRNGAALTLAAVALMREPVRLLVRSTDEPRTEQHGDAEVTWLGPYVGPYYEAWPELADALVLPRRYAGLCLPMQEAAALGLPIVALDVAPTNEWLPKHAMLPATGTERVRMRGGTIDVAAAEPAALAERLDELVHMGGFAPRLSKASRDWAASISWARWLAEYETLLG